MEIFKLFGTIFIKDEDAQKKLDAIDQKGKKTGFSLKRTFTGLGGSLFKLIGLAGLSFGFMSVMNSAADAQEKMAQLDAVLKSTGGAAGVTKKQVTDLASGFSMTTRFAKGMIIDGQNMLLTFTNIGKDVFPQVTETMLDMSQALGQDTKSSAMQLGKALNDPIKGVTALKRVGVTFTDAQVKQIKTLQNSGKMMEAQKVILAELSKEFGGSAKAAGGTFRGQVEILTRSLKGLVNQFGGLLLPYINAFVAYLNSHMPAIQATVKSVFDALSNAMKLLGNNMNWIIPIVAGLVGALVAFKVINGVNAAIAAAKILIDAWKASTFAQTLAQSGLNAALLANPIGLIIAAIGILIAIGVALYMNWDKVKVAASVLWAYLVVKFNGIKQSISNAWDGVKNKTAAAWAWIKSHLGIVLPAIGAVILGPIGLIVGFIIGNWNKIKSTTSTVFGAIKSKISSIWNAIKSTTISVWNGIKTAITNPIEAAKNKISGIIEKIKGFFSGLKLKIPKISLPKLPHFSLTGSFSLKPPSVPKLSVNWYDKGGIFNRPSIIGVGEKRKEFVGALDDLRYLISDELRKVSVGGLAAVTVTGNTFVIREEADIKKIANELHRLAEKEKRAKGIRG